MTFPPTGGRYGQPGDPGQQPGYGPQPGAYGQQPGGYGPPPGGYDQPGGGYGGFAQDPHDPLIGLEIGQWFSRGLNAFKRTWKALLAVFAIQAGVMTVLVGLLIGLVFALVTGALVLGDRQREGAAGGLILLLVPAYLVFFFIMLLISAWSQIASVSVVVRSAAGRGGLREAMRDGRRRLWAMFGWSLLAGLVTVIGVIFCILPGVVVALVVSALLAPVVLLEPDASPWERLTNLPQRVGGQFWGRLALTAVVSIVIGGAVNVVTQALLTPITALLQRDGADQTTAVVAALAIGTLTMVVSTVANLVTQILVTCLNVGNYMTSRFTESGGQVTTPVAAAALP